jgi:hypothetical protein
MAAGGAAGAAAAAAAQYTSSYRVKFERKEFLELVEIAKPRMIYRVRRIHFFAFDGFVMYSLKCEDRDFSQPVMHAMVTDFHYLFFYAFTAIKYIHLTILYTDTTLLLFLEPFVLFILFMPSRITAPIFI